MIGPFLCACCNRFKDEIDGSGETYNGGPLCQACLDQIEEESG